MKKRLITMGLLCMAAGAVIAAQDNPGRSNPVKTLAGTAPVEKTLPPDQLRPEKNQGNLPRDFVQQPPLIPHSTRGYQITKNFNQCMDCHAWSKYREKGATKVSITHFRDQSGQELSNVSPRRYFCTQCHVPQTDAKPLVANEFRTGQGSR